jgi:hypothetical protein
VERVPFAPLLPVPALRITLWSVTRGDATMDPAMLEPPGVFAFAASNSRFAKVSADETFVIDSGIEPGAGWIFTCWCVGS